MQKYSPIRLSIIIILGLIFFIVLGILYTNKTDVTDWLVCDSTGTYKEKLRFKYIEKKLYGYYREEYLSFKSKSDLEKGMEYFKKQKEGLSLNSDFSYKYSSKDYTITVKTYINVVNRKDLFNNYISDMEINNESTIGEVRAFLELNKYECSVK